MVIPSSLLVVDDGRTQTPRRIDAGSGDGDGGQMNQEHREADGQRRQHRNMGVACVALRIGGGEDGVHEDESADNLRSESAAFGVAAVDDVRAAAEHLVL